MQSNISKMEGAYRTVFEIYDNHSLFRITSESLDVVSSVNRLMQYQVRWIIADLCKKIGVSFNRNFIDSQGAKDADFFEDIDGRKIAYRVSLNEVSTPHLDETVATDIDQYVSIVLTNNLVNHPDNSHSAREYRKKHKFTIKNMSLRDFFDDIRPGEFEVFQEYIDQFNHDAEIMLGFTVAPTPTKKAIQEKFEKVKREFDKFFFKDILITNGFTEDEINELKIPFAKKNILGIHGSAYIHSFVSSEWYYDLLEITDWQMEQTAVVAGYLKSIEQLLFALMLSRCGDRTFTLWNKKTEKYEPLTLNNQEDLLSMAGNLIKSIDINYRSDLGKVYYSSSIGSKIQAYLKYFFETKRNGYFHKDNIYTTAQISDARKEAYCAFFLLASAFNCNVGLIN